MTRATSAPPRWGAVLAGIGVAHPPAMPQWRLWQEFFSRHYAGAGRVLAKRIFDNAGVVTRHAVANPLVEDVSGWSTGARMERFVVEAPPLALAAARSALRDGGISPQQVGLLVVCTCTGYATPGLDIGLARELGLSVRAQRLVVGHMGCYAALPGLGVCADFVTSHRRAALLVCVELPSLHIQPPTVDPQQMVAHALFSDAAAAAVLVPPGPGADAGSRPRVVEVASRTDTATAELMTWHVTDLGFRMGLSPQVPEVLARHVGPLVADVLGRNGLAAGQVGAWAVHPGGPRILDVVRDSLGLAEEDLAASRQCLAEHGNCSSPTVLVILETLLRRAAGGAAARAAPVLAMAFGPGLTLYAALLR